jgi:excisionase family DNA binding protein
MLSMNKKLTPAEVAEILGVPERTLSQWRYKGVGPRYARIGKYVRYAAEDVEAYFEQRTNDADA